MKCAVKLFQSTDVMRRLMKKYDVIPRVWQHRLVKIGGEVANPITHSSAIGLAPSDVQRKHRPVERIETAAEAAFDPLSLELPRTTADAQATIEFAAAEKKLQQLDGPQRRPPPIN